MSKMDSFLNLSPLNTTVSRKVISFSDISAVNLMVGWNLEFMEFEVASANTRNSSLFSRIFFFFRSSDVHLGKKAKETRANWRPSGLRSSHFLSKRAGNGQTSAPRVSKTILLPSSPFQRGAVGGEGNLVLLLQTTPAHFL